MPLILFYYNTAPTEALTQMTPFECLFLRTPKSPLSLNVKDKLKTAWTAQFGNCANEIFTSIAKNHKKRFNAQHVVTDSVPTKLKRNQKVLIYKPQPKGQSKKLYRKWDGPFRVQRETSKNVYLLINLNTGKRLKRNIDLIRLLPQDSDQIIGPKINEAMTSISNAPIWRAHDSLNETENIGSETIENKLNNSNSDSNENNFEISKSKEIEEDSEISDAGTLQNDGREQNLLPNSNLRPRRIRNQPVKFKDFNLY